MSEYIEREKVLALQTDLHFDNIEQLKHWKCRHIDPTEVQLLPAADVRPVILCRDCIHYEMGACLKIYDDGNVSADAWQERKPDDFCSYGEDRNDSPEMTESLWED